MTIESLHNFHCTLQKSKVSFQLNQNSFAAFRHDIKMKIMPRTCFCNIRENRFHKKVTKIEMKFYQAFCKYCLSYLYPTPCCTKPNSLLQLKTGLLMFFPSLINQSTWCFEIHTLNCADTKTHIFSLYLACRCTNTKLMCSALFALYKI